MSANVDSRSVSSTCKLRFGSTYDGWMALHRQPTSGMSFSVNTNASDIHADNFSSRILISSILSSPNANLQTLQRYELQLSIQPQQQDFLVYIDARRVEFRTVGKGGAC